MDKVISEETFIHKNRSFIIQRVEKSDAFYVYVRDPKTDKIIDTGFCRHEEYAKICKRNPPKDPIDEIADILKKSVALWVDKGLI